MLVFLYHPISGGTKSTVMEMTLFVRTVAELKKVERVQAMCLNKYNSVQVLPHGLDMVRIIAQ